MPHEREKLKVTVHQGPEAVESARSAWEQASDAVPESPFFTVYEWHAPHLSLLEGDPAGVVVLELWRGDRCRGLVPLQTGHLTKRGVRLRLLSLPASAHMNLTDFLLAEGEDFAEFWPSILRSLARVGGGWHALRWSPVLESSSALRAAKSLGRRAIVRPRDRSNYFDCAVPYSEITAGFSTKLRKSLRRGRKTLDKTGSWQVVTVAGPDQRLALDEFLRVEASGWKGAEGKGSAIKLNARAEEFYRRLFARGPGRVCPEVSLLVLGEKAVSGQLRLVRGQTRSILKIGYEEAFRQLSPGGVLLEETLRSACQRRNPRFVSLVTNTPWEQEWGPRYETTYDVWVFRNALWASLARIAAALRRPRSLPGNPAQPGAAPTDRLLSRAEAGSSHRLLGCRHRSLFSPLLT